MVSKAVLGSSAMSEGVKPGGVVVRVGKVRLKSIGDLCLMLATAAMPTRLYIPRLRHTRPPEPDVEKAYAPNLD